MPNEQHDASLYDTDPKSPTFRQLLVLELYLPSLSFDPSENRRPFFGSNFTGLRAKNIDIMVASQKEMTDLSIDASAKAIVYDLVNRGAVSVKIRPDLVREAVVRRGDRQDPLAVRMRTTFYASMSTTYGDQDERDRIAWDAAAQLARKLHGNEILVKMRKLVGEALTSDQLAILRGDAADKAAFQAGDPIKLLVELAARAAKETAAFRELLGQEVE